MKTQQIMLAIFTIAGIMLVGSITPALAANDLVCEGTVRGGEYDNVKVPKGADCVLRDVTVNGNIHAANAASIWFHLITVDGNVVITHTEGRVVILITEITGNLEVVSNTADSSFSGVAASTIGGNLVFNNNQGNIIFLDTNEVGGQLICKHNDPIVGIETNIVQGKVNCT